LTTRLLIFLLDARTEMSGRSILVRSSLRRHTEFHKAIMIAAGNLKATIHGLRNMRSNSALRAFAGGIAVAKPAALK
jgi:hypothetical protein